MGLVFQVLYLPRGQRLSYRDILLEQVRLWVRQLWGKAAYVPPVVWEAQPQPH